MPKRKEETNTNPRPKREDFDHVLKNLLNSPPITREEVHKERKKRKKKLSKVIGEDTLPRP